MAQGRERPGSDRIRTDRSPGRLRGDGGYEQPGSRYQHCVLEHCEYAQHVHHVGSVSEFESHAFYCLVAYSYRRDDCNGMRYSQPPHPQLASVTVLDNGDRRLDRNRRLEWALAECSGFVAGGGAAGDILLARGDGDVKLCAAIGAWIGPQQLGTALVMMGIAGGLMALLWAAYGGYLKESLSGAGDLIFGVGKRGLRPHATLLLANPSSRKMPYAPAIAFGTIFSFLAVR
jgi:prepilin signal peptidase PulO-like enzyme (type II secretory pathway)